MSRKNPPSHPLRRTPVRGAVVLITGGASGIGRLMGLEAARRGVSFTRLLLPEPETPVTHMNLPRGKSTSMFF